MNEFVLRFSLDYVAFVLVSTIAAAVMLVWLRRQDGQHQAHQHILLFLVVVFMTGWFLVEFSGNRERDRLRIQIEGLAPTYAEELQEMGHAKIELGLEKGDPYYELYEKMLEKQRRWLDINQTVADIYTFRNHPLGNQLIVDSETDYDGDGRYEGEREGLTEIGEIWTEESEFIDRAHAGEACFDDSPYTDRWGTWVTAMVPMYNERGEVEAVLGVDFPADDWASAILRARLTWIGILLVLVTIGIASTSVISVLRTSIHEKVQNEQALQEEQKLLRRLIDLQEGERRMVAHDIHDGFVQDVVGAHMLVQCIESTADPTTNEQTATRAGALLEKAISEGRRLILDMRPLVLDESGVVEAIRHLLAEEKAGGELVVAFNHEVQFDRLEPRLEGVIFRIVQEAINNVRRHAQTDHAAVQMRQLGDRLEIVIRDHGVGFDPNAVTFDRFGIRGMRERARLYGGEAEIVSAPGRGTIIRVTVPIQTEV